jgi:hypothetical protein
VRWWGNGASRYYGNGTAGGWGVGDCCDTLQVDDRLYSRRLDEVLKALSPARSGRISTSSPYVTVYVKPSKEKGIHSLHSRVIWSPLSPHSSTAQKKPQKTYNRGDSLMVAHLTTNPPVRCLNMAERTGSLVVNVLWSYVEEIVVGGDYIYSNDKA